MRLLSLVRAATFILTNALAELPTPNCMPQADQETCLLVWITNTGVDINMDNPDDFPVWAHATIYSPTCVAIGSTTNGLDDNVKLYAWGLSITEPLILSPAVVEGLSYNTPQFSYHGQVWGYEDCQCEWGDLTTRTHVCRCPFQCEDEPVIV
jgi:hypothetical protein